jgi:hypothetical protein
VLAQMDLVSRWVTVIDGQGDRSVVCPRECHGQDRRLNQTRLPLRREGLRELRLATGGEQDGPAVRILPGPGKSLDPTQQGAAKAARQMGAPLTPIEAFAA